MRVRTQESTANLSHGGVKRGGGTIRISYAVLRHVSSPKIHTCSHALPFTPLFQCFCQVCATKLAPRQKKAPPKTKKKKKKKKNKAPCAPHTTPPYLYLCYHAQKTHPTTEHNAPRVIKTRTYPLSSTSTLFLTHSLASTGTHVSNTTPNDDDDVPLCNHPLLCTPPHRRPTDAASEICPKTAPGGDTLSSSKSIKEK